MKGISAEGSKIEILILSITTVKDLRSLPCGKQIIFMFQFTFYKFFFENSRKLYPELNIRKDFHKSTWCGFTTD